MLIVESKCHGFTVKKLKQIQANGIQSSKMAFVAPPSGRPAYAQYIIVTVGAHVKASPIAADHYLFW